MKTTASPCWEIRTACWASRPWGWTSTPPRRWRHTAIIYLTEELAAGLEHEIARYKDALTPAIILIPGKSGSLGIGMANVKKSVERAVGADILGG